jgi:hypothetical protein
LVLDPHELNLLIDGLGKLALTVAAAVAGGITLNRILFRQGLKWTWALAGLPVASVVLDFARYWGIGIAGASLLAASIGARWHRDQLAVGVDIAEAARNRVGIRDVIDRVTHRRRSRREGWIAGDRLTVGRDRKHLPVTIPIGTPASGSHTLVVGATGSGKIVSAPTGDELLRDELRGAARRADRPFLEWTPTGPCTYNPYGDGGPSEIADKALSGETFTEPHYLRQAQRYLGHAVRTLQAIGHEVTPRALMEAMNPELLDALARELDENDATSVHAYLDALDDRQKRDLEGVRDRLSILAESDIGPRLEPAPGIPAIDLHNAIAARAVVYFRLDADRQPLLSQMLAAAVISDLITLVAAFQRRPVPTVVVIDEFAAVAAAHVARPFGRARSAGISPVLGTQELADLKATSDGVREQVLGNVAAVIAHRQNVPESAELIAAMAGTQAAWVTTEQTDTSFLGAGRSGRGSRRRGFEYRLHPGLIKALGTGEAAVLSLSGRQRATVARMHHPREATR